MLLFVLARSYPDQITIQHVPLHRDELIGLLNHSPAELNGLAALLATERREHAITASRLQSQMRYAEQLNAEISSLRGGRPYRRGDTASTSAQAETTGPGIPTEKSMLRLRALLRARLAVWSDFDLNIGPQRLADTYVSMSRPEMVALINGDLT